MPAPDLDFSSLSPDERVELIERLWLSIAIDARRGDQRAAELLDMHGPVDPELLVELARRADELERDPSRGIPWEVLRQELLRKYG
jgi:putative addiction module component (TIGR02574 family)